MHDTLLCVNPKICSVLLQYTIYIYNFDTLLENDFVVDTSKSGKVEFVILNVSDLVGEKDRVSYTFTPCATYYMIFC